MMNSLLPIIDDLYQKFSLKLPLPIEQQGAFDKKIRLEFNFNSNHLEGNTLTYAETEILLYSNEIVGAHSFRELQEMKASDLALDIVKSESRNQDSHLTEKFIKELNQVLLVEPYWKEAKTESGALVNKEILIGQYKQDSNYVILEDGQIHKYVSPSNTPIEMAELVKWVNEAIRGNSQHPIEIAAKLHYDIVRIHPFDDGNGRIARLLMNYILLKHNYPPVIIKSDDKKNYLRSLRAADGGMFDRFVEYIAQQQIWSLKLAIKASNGESLNEEEDWKKRLQIINRELSNRDAVQIVKSSDVIVRIVCILIPNTINSILENLSEISKLFLGASCFITTSDRKTVWDIKSIVPANYIVQASFSEKIDVVIRLEEFAKNPDNPFTVEDVFEIVFYKHKYEIIHSESIQLKKLYHQTFTEDEINKLSNIIGDRLTLVIEDQIMK